MLFLSAKHFLCVVIMLVQFAPRNESCRRIRLRRNDLFENANPHECMGTRNSSKKSHAAFDSNQKKKLNKTKKHFVKDMMQRRIYFAGKRLHYSAKTNYQNSLGTLYQ